MDKTFVQKRMMEYARDSEKSMEEISRKMGHSHGYVHNIAKGHFTPSLEEVLYFCTYLDIAPSDFFREESLTYDQQLLTAKIPSLPPGQVRLLLELVEQFKQQYNAPRRFVSERFSFTAMRR